MATGVPGTEGYAETAQDYLLLDGRLSFEEVHAPVLHLMPKAACDVLDIGSGSGRDAAHLARKGHSVVAVEPTDALRTHAIATHRAAGIHWIDDSLPNLALTRALGRTFNLVLLTGVWMHLDDGERRRAMPNVSALMRENALAIMSLRHGPVPPGRRMFDVAADETIDLARNEGMECVLNIRTPSVQEHNRRAGVTWTRLAFRKASTNRVARRTT